MPKKIMRTYRFRLYPNLEQEKKLQNTLAVCRWVYNRFVQLAQKRFVSQYDLQTFLIELKEQEQWLRNYHSKMLQMIALQVHSAEKALVQMHKNGHNTGFLRLLKYNNFTMFCYNQSGFKIEKHGREHLLWLSKIGYVPIRLHRNVVGQIKQIQIVKTADKWFACIGCEIYCATSEMEISKIIQYPHVGVDLGVKNFVYLSDGTSTKNPLYYVRNLHVIKRAQMKMSRRFRKNIKQQSDNYKKALKHYQKIHQRIANRRKDFQHKLSTQITKKYPVVFIENLNISNMVGNTLAQRILDSGWAGFINKLQYKAKSVIRISPYNTSVICSKCGHHTPKTLATRIHKCSQCGLQIDRDYNAAKNIDMIGFNKLHILNDISKKTIENSKSWQNPSSDQKSESKQVLQELQEPTSHHLSLNETSTSVKIEDRSMKQKNSTSLLVGVHTISDFDCDTAF